MSPLLCLKKLTKRFPKYDFQFILLQLLLINVYYIAYQFYLKWSQVHKIISKLASEISGRVGTVPQTFQASKGAANLLLPVDGIAYFYRDDDSIYLRTVSGEDYFVIITLDEVQQQLTGELFFRANRQLIANRTACKAYHLLTYGKLNVRLEPPLAGDAVVSQQRAKDFKHWIDNI